MIIRPATTADIPDLSRIAAASYAAAFRAIVGDETLAVRGAAHFADRFSEQWPDLRVLELAGEGIAGGRLAGFHEVRGGKLDMLFLHPDFIGQGFGASLLADAERQGATRLDCFRDNHAARRFYERRGWRMVGEFDQPMAGRLFASVAYERPLIGS